MRTPSASTRSQPSISRPRITKGEVCGRCPLGCRLGAKQSTVKTWLADAHAAGGRLVVRTRAERVIVEGGAARGVQARTADGHRVTVRSRAVGAITGAATVPQVFINGRLIGNAEDLEAYLRKAA